MSQRLSNSVKECEQGQVGEARRDVGSVECSSVAASHYSALTTAAAADCDSDADNDCANFAQRSTSHERNAVAEMDPKHNR